MTLLGIIFGLLCALLMSLSYLFVRQDMTGDSSAKGGRARGQFNFLVRSQVIQGVIAAASLYWLWPVGLNFNLTFTLYVIGAGGFFLIGQAGLLTAMRYTEASRISPLLSLKIVGVAFLTVVLLGEPLTALQWLGVFMAVGAAFMLSYTGGRLPLVAIIAALVPCVFYACSDICVGQTILSIKTLDISLFHTGVFAAAIIYTFCGLAGLIVLPWAGSKKAKDWSWVLPFSIIWLAAEVCLFSCFAFVGIVLGGILQSTRGIASIVIGAVAAALGYEHLEQRISRAIFWRRLGAAALMTGAIAVYLLG